MRKIWLKYSLCFLFVGVMAAWYVGGRDLNDLQTRYRLLCDGLTIPGVLLLCAGSLAWVSNQGALDGISYGLSLALRALIPGKSLSPRERYGDFVARKRANPLRGYGFLLICGGLTVALSLMFLFLYMVAASPK